MITPKDAEKIKQWQYMYRTGYFNELIDSITGPEEQRAKSCNNCFHKGKGTYLVKDCIDYDYKYWRPKKHQVTEDILKKNMDETEKHLNSPNKEESKGVDHE